MFSMITAIQLPEGVTVDTERYRFALGTYPEASQPGHWIFTSDDGAEVQLSGPLSEIVHELPEGDWTLQS